jgi:hypothetical protein
MTHKDFFYLKELSGSLGSNFSKTTENETVKMTGIKIVTLNRRNPYTFSYKTSYSQENYKNIEVNNRRKTKSAAALLVLQPAHSKKLPIGDTKKADIFDLLSKNHTPKFYATFYESLYISNYYNTQGIIRHFLYFVSFLIMTIM